MPPVKYHHGKFPPPSSEIDWEQLVPLIGPATMALGEFKGLLDAIPNPMVLLSRKAWIQDKTHSRYRVAIMDDFLFSQPIFKATDLGAFQGVPPPTRKRILREIRDDLLLEVRPASGPRSAIYACQELLNIEEGKEVFSGS